MSIAQIKIHSTQFPENVQRDLLHSLRTRTINNKFHYDTYKQAQKWLAVHQVHSPFRTDANCVAIYDQAFAGASERILAPKLQVIGLGCGGGQKDARLLRLLATPGREISYSPCDVSVALLLAARQAALDAVPNIPCDPLVCDLAEIGDLSAIFNLPSQDPTIRLITFFGMIPNFEPSLILPRLAELVRSGDWLLFSANLAPGPHYAAGVRRVLPGYNNALTQDWLTTFLFDLGFTPNDGAVRFAIENSAEGHKKVTADFYLTRPRTITIHSETFSFTVGEKIRLFFSYRYTPNRVRRILKAHELILRDQWVSESGEEGVFLCQRE